MELNKYYGEDGLVIDPVLGFTSSSKDISDLIKERGIEVASNLIKTLINEEVSKKRKE